MECPLCKKTIDLNGKAPVFCPWCGHSLKDAGNEPEFEEMLDRARAETDSVKKHDILIKARETFGVRREIEKELLFLGRLYERGGKPDFYRIPYWPLNAIEKPREFSKRERQKMLDSFFKNPELERVANMYEDPNSLINEYLEHMAVEYVRVFMQGSNSNTFFLGFRRGHRDIVNRCEMCMKKMLQNLNELDGIPDEIRKPMHDALVKGFDIVFGKDSEARLSI